MAAAASLPYRVQDDKLETVGGTTSVCTVHLVQGLEFRVALRPVTIC